MDTRNPKETPTHSIAFHEDQLPLFDAYVTNELDENERAQLEQDLHHCQECQHLLTEITQLRQTLGTLLKAEHSSVLVPEHLHSRQMVHAILVGIEQGANREDHPVANQARQEKTRFHALDAYSPALLARRQARSRYLSLGAVVFCILLLVSLIITLRNVPASSENRHISVPPPVVWILQQHPMLVQNSAGVFALKEIEITTVKEFRFYYAFQSSHQGTLHVSAVSSLNAGQEQPITLPATALPLGTIDDVSVGVIRIQYLDRVGQTITLRITSPEEGSASWQLTPLKQQLAEPHPEGGGFYRFPIDQHLFSEIIWSGPTSGPGEYSMISLFKNATGTRYIFLEVDYAGEIIVITREKCIQLVGEQICH